MSKPLNFQTPSKIKKLMNDLDDKNSSLYKSLSEKQKALLNDKQVNK